MICKAIIFDLDGTLINTLADLCHAMNFALKAVGQPVHSIEECRRMIGNGVRTFAERALGAEQQGLRDEVLEIMKARYRDKCFDNSELYNGIAETVIELRKMGIRLAVITNKDQDAAEKIVGHFFEKAVFECIKGVRGERTVKPDPWVTEEIISQMGLKPDDYLFIGDSEVDIETASGAGVRSVGATWGFRSRVELMAAGADILIDEPREILDLIS